MFPHSSDSTLLQPVAFSPRTLHTCHMAALALHPHTCFSIPLRFGRNSLKTNSVFLRPVKRSGQLLPVVPLLHAETVALHTASISLFRHGSSSRLYCGDISPVHAVQRTPSSVIYALPDRKTACSHIADFCRRRLLIPYVLRRLEHAEDRRRSSDSSFCLLV